MATFTSVISGSWSAGATWGGVAPADDGTAKVIIAAGTNVLMNVVQTVGLATGADSLTIQGHATDPGMLSFKDGTSGKLIIATGGHIIGTTGVRKGRILASETGTWFTTGGLAGAYKGLTGTVTDGGGDKRIFTPAISPLWIADALFGESITINGATYAIEDNDATTVTLTTGPAIGAVVMAWLLVVRPLPQDHTAVIKLLVTAHIDAQYLDICLLSKEPTTKSIRCYGQVFHDCATNTDDTITFTGHGMANGTIVTLSLQAGQTIPVSNPQIAVNTEYFVVSTAANTFKLSLTSGGAAIDLTTAGAGYAVNTHVGMYRNWGITGNTLTKTAHGLVDDVAICVKSSGTLPTPLLANTVYFVKLVDANTISLKLNKITTPVLTLGVNGAGQLDVYTGTVGDVYSGGIGGTFKNTTYKVNVLDDVTGESTFWVPAAGTFATTTANNAVVLVDDNDISFYDQHRDTIAAVTATMVSLEAVTGVIDGALWPNARLVLVARNVAIQSSCATDFGIIDYTTAPGASGIYGCEIRSVAQTGVSTTFRGYGVNYGTSHTISGPISGCYAGVYYGTGHTISGAISGCYNGVYYGTSHMISGPISGCQYGVYDGTGHVISGPISGCYNGVNTGTNHTISGPISGCNTGVYYGTGHTISGPISGCYNGVNTGTGHTIIGLISGCYNGVYYGTGHTISGAISGCYNGVYYGTSHMISGPISGCQYGVYDGTSHTILSLLSGNTYDLYNCTKYLLGYGATLASNIQNQSTAFGYNSPVSIESTRHMFYDYGGNPGYVRAFMPCGQITTLTDAPSITSGITYSYQHLGELPGTGGLQRAVVCDMPIYGKAGVPVEITIYEKCAINPSLFVEGPQFAICDPSKVIRSAGSVLNVEGLVSAQSLGNDTNWHTTRLTYTPTTGDKQLILRSYAKCMVASTLTGVASTGLDGAVTSTSIFTPSVAPGWTIDALIGMAVRFESDFRYYIITDNDATTITVAGSPSNNANRGPWTIVGAPTSYLWMYTVDSMIPATAQDVLKGIGRWTGATGANIGTLERKVQELKI